MHNFNDFHKNRLKSSERKWNGMEFDSVQQISFQAGMTSDMITRFNLLETITSINKILAIQCVIKLR